MIRIDLQKVFSMVPREDELESLLGNLEKAEHYEIHITVKSDGEIEHFKEACATLEVKPLVVQLSNGAVPDDVMTSSDFRGTPSELRDECVRILVGLEVMSWNAIRCKVECSPFHEKVRDLQPDDMLPFQYFESHIPIKIVGDDDIGSLRVICRCYETHLSANAFKLGNRDRTLMATFRSSKLTADEFRKATDFRVDQLREALYDAMPPVVEFAIYDSKRSHDNEWLGLRGLDSAELTTWVKGEVSRMLSNFTQV